MSVPYECYFCLNLRSFFIDDQLSYIAQEAIFLWYLEPFKPPFYILIILCENHFEPPNENSFLYK